MAIIHNRPQKIMLVNENITSTSQQAITPPSSPHHRAMAAPVQDNSGLSASLPHQLEEDYDETSSKILLNINTPTIIIGDGNIVAIDAANTTKNVAMAVVTSLKQLSMGGAGIPMIDENGRPRELQVTVNAETRIEGTKNVVGERAILSRMGHNNAQGQSLNVAAGQVHGNANTHAHSHAHARGQAGNGQSGIGLGLGLGLGNIEGNSDVENKPRVKRERDERIFAEHDVNKRPRVE